MTTSPYTKLLEDLDKIQASNSVIYACDFFQTHGQFLRELALNAMPDEDRFNRARAMLGKALAARESDPDKIIFAESKLENAMELYPDGILVSTHQIGVAGTPGRLVAIWWQDDDYGSKFNVLVWSIS